MATTPIAKSLRHLMCHSTPFPNRHSDFDINDISPIDLNKNAGLCGKKRQQTRQVASVLKTGSTTNSIRNLDCLSKGCISGELEPSSVLELEIESSDEECPPSKKRKKNINNVKKTSDMNKISPTEKPSKPVKGKQITKIEVRRKQGVQNMFKETETLKTIDEEHEIVKNASKGNELAVVDVQDNPIKNEVVKNQPNKISNVDPVCSTESEGNVDGNNTDSDSCETVPGKGNKKKPVVRRARKRRTAKGNCNTVDDNDEVDDKLNDVNEPEVKLAIISCVDVIKESNENPLVNKTKTISKRNTRATKNLNKKNSAMVEFNKSEKELKLSDAIEKDEIIKPSKVKGQNCDNSKENAIESTVVIENSKWNLKPKCQREAIKITVNDKRDASISVDIIQVESKEFNSIQENIVNECKTEILTKSNIKEKSGGTNQSNSEKADCSINSCKETNKSVTNDLKSRSANNKMLTKEPENVESEKECVVNIKPVLSLNNSNTTSSDNTTETKASALPLQESGAIKRKTSSDNSLAPHDSSKNKNIQEDLNDNEAVVSSNSEGDAENQDNTSSKAEKKESITTRKHFKKANEVTSCTISSTVSGIKKSPEVEDASTDEMPLPIRKARNKRKAPENYSSSKKNCDQNISAEQICSALENDNIISSTTSGPKVVSELNINKNMEVSLLSTENKESGEFAVPEQQETRAKGKAESSNVVGKLKSLKKNDVSKINCVMEANDKCNVHNEKFLKPLLKKVDVVICDKNTTTDGVSQENSSVANKNIDVKKNVPVNCLGASENTSVSSNLVNSKATVKISVHSSKQFEQTSMPSMSVSSDTSKKIVSSSDLQSTKDFGEKKVRIKDADNFIKRPCHCKNERIQCFSQYAQKSTVSKKIFGKGVELYKCLKHEKSIMGGYMKIHGHSSISGKATNNTVYFVVEGNLMVNISGNVKNTKPKDCFMVVQNTEYEINNESEEHAELSFVKTARIL